MAKVKNLAALNKISKSAALKDTDTKKVSHAIQNTNLDTIQEVELDKIYDNPFQPRLDIKEQGIMELAHSIKENGLLQPISLNKISNDKYEVIAGHRRVAAHKYLNKKTIKAIIVSTLKNDDKEYETKMSSLALIENIQREQLDILETAISVSTLLEKKVYKNQASLAQAIGKPKIFITKCLAALKVSQGILLDISENKTLKDLDVLYYLQMIQDENIQFEMYKKYIAKEINRKDIIAYVKMIKNTDNQVTQSFTLNEKRGVLEINARIKELDSKAQENFKKELTALLDTYFK